MKKIILIVISLFMLLLSTILFTGCSSCSTEDRIDDMFGGRFVLVEVISSRGVNVIKDTKTDILYLYCEDRFGITPLYNADGTVMNIKDYYIKKIK